MTICDVAAGDASGDETALTGPDANDTRHKHGCHQQRDGNYRTTADFTDYR